MMASVPKDNDQTAREVLLEGFERAETRLKKVTEIAKDRAAFFRELQVLQAEAVHTLTLLTLNAWLLNKKSAPLDEYYRIIERNLQADLKTLKEAEEAGGLALAEMREGQNEPH